MRHRTLSWLGVLLCALVLAACGSSTSQTNGPPTPPTHTSVPGTPTTPALPPAGTISATISGLRTSGNVSIAASDSAVWFYNGDAGTLWRIDPSTNRVVATISVGHGPGSVAIGQGAVWVASPTEGTVSRIDPQTNQVAATVTLTPQCCVEALTISPGAVWVNEVDSNELIRIDAQTNQVVATIPNPGPTGVSFGAGSVWLCNRHSPTGKWLARFSPATNQAEAQIAFDTPCSTVVALAQTVWVMGFVNQEPDTAQLERIDPATNTVSATIKVPGALPWDFAADEQGVWVMNPATGLFHIDPQTNQVVGELALFGGFGVALGAGSVWVVNSSTGSLLRMTPAS